MLNWNEKDKELLNITMNNLGKRIEIKDENIDRINKELKNKTNGKISVRRSSPTSSALVVTKDGKYTALNLIDLIDLLQIDLGQIKTEKKRKRRKKITEKMRVKIIENDAQNGNVKKFIRENKISASTYYRILKKAKTHD